MPRGSPLITTSGVGHHYEPVLRTGLAQAMLGSGRIDAALQEAAAAADLAQQRGLGWAELPARLALALVLLSAGRTAEAGAAVSRGMTLTEETGIHLYDRALRSAGRRSGTAAAV